MIRVYLASISYFLFKWNLLEYIWIASQIFFLSGDIEMNPVQRSHSLPMPFNWSLEFTSKFHFYQYTFFVQVSFYIPF